MRNILLGLFGVLIVGGAIGLAFVATQDEKHPASDVTQGASGKQTYTIEVDGVEREFIVYRPANIPADEEVPVVFMFHGTSGTGEKFYRISGWKEVADAEGIMAVFPTAMRYHVFDDEKVVKGGAVKEDVAAYTTKWNYLGFEKILDPAYPDQVVYDDIHFTQAMVDFVEENYATDSSRMYASGFSNGSQFTERLSLQMWDTFAAFAYVGSGAGISDTSFAKVNDYADGTFIPRPSSHVVGEVDPKLNHAAEVESFPMDESAIAEGTLLGMSVYSHVDHWGLTQEYTYEKTGRFSQFIFDQPTDGTAGAPLYSFTIVEGMAHVYPNGTNFPVKGAELFWDFFEQYSL